MRHKSLKTLTEWTQKIAISAFISFPMAITAQNATSQNSQPVLPNRYGSGGVILDIPYANENPNNTRIENFRNPSTRNDDRGRRYYKPNYYDDRLRFDRHDNSDVGLSDARERRRERELEELKQKIQLLENQTQKQKPVTNTNNQNTTIIINGTEVVVDENGDVINTHENQVETSETENVEASDQNTETVIAYEVDYENPNHLGTFTNLLIDESVENSSESDLDSSVELSTDNDE